MKLLRRAVRIGIAVGLLGIVAIHVDWLEFVDVATRADPAWLVLAFAVSTGDRVLMATKWRYLLTGIGVNTSFREAVVYYYMGGLVGTALQWHLSGDIARAVSLGRRTERHSAVTASVILEKIAGLQALTLLAGGSTLLLNARLRFIGWIPLTLLVVGVVVIVAVAPFFVRAAGARETLLDGLEGWSKLDRFADALRSIPDDVEETFKKVYAAFLFATLLEQLVPTVLLFLYTQAFAVELTLLEIVSVLPLVTLLARLPISVESLGVMEGLFVYFLGLVGVGTATAVVLALVSRLMDMIVMVVGAGVCSFTSEWRIARSTSDSDDAVSVNR